MKLIEQTKRRLLSNQKVKMHCYPWPQGTSGTSTLKDILEDSPDPKYFLSQEKSDQILSHLSSDRKAA